MQEHPAPAQEARAGPRGLALVARAAEIVDPVPLERPADRVEAVDRVLRRREGATRDNA